MSNLSTLAKNYAAKYQVSVAEATKVLKNAIEVIEDAIVSDGGVQLTGHFSIETSHRKERQGKDFHTHQPITIPASVGIKAKAGKDLKTRLNA